MDLMVFMPKTPVSLSAQIHKHVTNGEYSGATLDNRDGSGRRYFTAGFSVSELEALGLTDSTQLSQLRSMDDAGSIDLVTFESDPDNLGFILTEDLHNVIRNAKDDLQKLKHAAWTIFEIQVPLSETPFEGSLKPLTFSNGTVYRVAFANVPSYFKHVTETGELMPKDFLKGDDRMAESTTNESTNEKEYTYEELQELMKNGDTSESGSLSLDIAEKKTFEEELFNDGEEYYQDQLKREEAERRRKEEEIRQKAAAERQRAEQERLRRAQQAKEKAATKTGDIVIPDLIPFAQIVANLNIHPDSDIQRFYLSNLNALADYADSMNIDPSIFNSFDVQGRRDLMIAMNREREKLVNQALVQLKREALAAEEQVSVDSEDASVSVREKHVDLYMKPLEQRQLEMRDTLDQFMEEREELLQSGFKEWYERVESDPRAVYDEIYRKPLVEDVIHQEKERLNASYDSYRADRQKELDDYINEFVEKRRARDLTHLQLDWGETARLGAQTLNDRVDSARGQMDSRRMMTEMREMYKKIEEQSNTRLEELQQVKGEDKTSIDRQSQTARPSGTVQQQRPEPRVQAPNAPKPAVEEPKQEPVARAVPTPPVPQVARFEPEQPYVAPQTPAFDEPEVPSFDNGEYADNQSDFSNQQWPEQDVAYGQEYSDDQSYDNTYEQQDANVEQAPRQSAPQPVINRPRDMYPQNQPTGEEDPWDDYNEDDDDDLEHDSVDDYDDDDWDDEELDDSEVAKKPRKKGLRGLFGKR